MKWTPYMLSLARDTKLSSEEISTKLSLIGIKIGSEAIRQKRHRLGIKCGYKGGKGPKNQGLV